MTLKYLTVTAKASTPINGIEAKNMQVSSENNTFGLKKGVKVTVDGKTNIGRSMVNYKREAQPIEFEITNKNSGCVEWLSAAYDKLNLTFELTIKDPSSGLPIETYENCTLEDIGDWKGGDTPIKVVFKF